MAYHLVSARYTYYPHVGCVGTVVTMVGNGVKAVPTDVIAVKRLQAKLMKMPGATYNFVVNQFNPAVFDVEVEVKHCSWG